MNLDGREIVSFVENNPAFKGEVEAFWKSIKRLPQYDYSRFYGNNSIEASIIEQGDGLNDLLIINLPSDKIVKAPSMVLSSTCDIDPRNTRRFGTRVVYAPILKLSKYMDMLKKNKKYDEQHIHDIRENKVGQIFYLPPGKNLDHEAIVFFSNVCSCDSTYLREFSIENKRIFRLSPYGWYVFLSKLSVFFARLTDETVEFRFST